MCGLFYSMLAELYIEALLTDSRLADQVWELWDAGLILDELAAIAWWLVATSARFALAPQRNGH